MRTPPAGAIDPLFALVRAPGEAASAALAAAVAELDRFGVERAGIDVDDDPELAQAALERHPARFFARTEVDPHRGMDELRRLSRLAREWPLRLVTASPARLFLPIDDKRFYPLFAKCVELGVALSPSLGVPEQRVPFSPQKVERIDAVACSFPELRIVMRGGCEPWQALAVLLMRRHPNLSYATSPLPPSEVPRTAPLRCCSRPARRPTRANVSTRSYPRSASRRTPGGVSRATMRPASCSSAEPAVTGRCVCASEW
jgi:hypothetical protein